LSETDEDATMLHGLTDLLERDEPTQRAWLARDRGSLLARTSPIFEMLRQRYRVTHFYFHDPNQTCFLRVHQPERSGDRITRFTLSQAVERGEPTEGVELGPLGTLTLRVVHPWTIEGKHVGYIELGCEIDRILRRIQSAAGGELIVFAEKQFLDREQWESGMKMVGREPDWDQFPDHAVLDATLPGTPHAVAGRFTEVRATDLSHSFALSFEGRSYQCVPIPLADAAGRWVGHVLVMADVTREHVGLGTLAGTIAVVGLPLFAVWCCCFYFYIRRLEQRLVATQKSRLLELERRCEAEARIQDLAQVGR
ncbi:MAG: cache domain-containing protein, partial [Phycisphaerales bacterium]